MTDLVSRLRGIVHPADRKGPPYGEGRSGPCGPADRKGPPHAEGGPGPCGPAESACGPAIRELTYEPEPRTREAIMNPERIAAALGGEPAGDGARACVRVRRRYESDRRHGEVRVGDCDCASLDVLTHIDPSVASCAPPALFFDLETTGLSGGAGTVAFLVGCAWFDDGALEVEQYLLTSYAAERSLLAQFAERVGTAGVLVSYNGRTFDAPLLEMRWQFHRSQAPTTGKPHADMLHPARRLWRMRDRDLSESGCSLSVLEQVLFGVRRVNDVPGFEIPSRFFQFLRSGDARPLDPVLEHNRYDLVSLAALTARVIALVRDGADACRDGWERLALGRLFDRVGDVDRARTCFESATRDRVPAVQREALARLAARHRREKRYGEAADAWQRVFALASDGEDDERGRALAREAAEALAIHQEHRARDLDRARELALAALRLERGRRGADALRYRLQRIDRKLDERRKKGSGAFFGSP